jgi:uncharacterized protein (TIGR03067 family)
VVLNKPEPRLRIGAVYVDTASPLGRVGPLQLPTVFPSGTSQLNVLIEFDGRPPGGTTAGYTVLSSQGLINTSPPANKSGYAATSMTIDSPPALCLFATAPGSGFPDGPYRTIVKINGTDCFELNWSVGGPGPSADTGSGPGLSKPDPDLQGTWKLSLVYDQLDNAKKSYLVVSAKEFMTIKGNLMSVEREVDGKKTTVNYTLEVDRTKNPRVYKRFAADGKKTAISGIYAIEKARLRMCFQADGKPPEAFIVSRDDGKDRLIFEFDRVVKGKP